MADYIPNSHRRYRDWTYYRILREAAAVGDDTAALVEVIRRLRPHLEQRYRFCIGILGLSKRYSIERLDGAYARALADRVPACSLIAFVKRDVSADDGCCLPPCFFVRQARTVSSSRPDVIKAARTVAVKQSRRPPAQPAHSVLDRDEHGAILEQVLGLASYGAVSNHLR